MIAAADLARRLAGLEPIGLRRARHHAAGLDARGRGRGGRGSPRSADELGLRVERRPRRQPVGAAGRAGAVVGRRLAPRQRARRRALRRRARGVRRLRGRRARARWRSSPSPTRRARASTRRPSAAARWPGRSTPAVLERRDDDGVRLADAMRAAGVDPAGRRAGARVARAAARLPRAARRPDPRPRALRRRARAWRRGCACRPTCTAAPTTPAPRRRHERSDALLRAAILIVAAHQRATDDMVVTASRILVEPNALTTIAAHVRLWLDARSENPAALSAWLEDLPAGAELTVASRSDGVTFDAALRAALGDAGRRGVLRRPRCGHPGREAPRGHGPHAQPERASATPPTRRPTSTTPPPPPTRSWRSCDEDRDDRRHAQRALPRLPARPARRSGERNPDDFWSWRTQMMHLAQALDPESMQRVAAQVYGEMLAAGYGAVGEFHYVHHDPDGTPYDEPNALALAVAQAALDVGLPIVLIPAAYHRGGHPRFHDPDVESFLRASTRCASGPTGATASRSRVAAHSVRAVPARLARGDRRLRRATTGCPPRARLRAAARGARLPRPARRQPDRAARAHRLPRAADERHPRHPRRRARRGAAGRQRHDRRHLPDDRGQPRRRQPAGAGLSRRRGAAGDRLGLAGPRRPLRGDARARDRRAPRGHARAARCSPTTATCGPSWRRNGLASLGLEGGDTIDVDLDHPDLRGVGQDELALALATCASAGVVCRQASRVRAGGGSLS